MIDLQDLVDLTISLVLRFVVPIALVCAAASKAGTFARDLGVFP